MTMLVTLMYGDNEQVPRVESLRLITFQAAGHEFVSILAMHGARLCVRLLRFSPVLLEFTMLLELLRSTRAIQYNASRVSTSSHNG
jgi:hypothetical protein